MATAKNRLRRHQMLERKHEAIADETSDYSLRLSDLESAIVCGPNATGHFWTVANGVGAPQRGRDTMTVFARFSEEFPDREETRILLLVNKATGQEQLRLYLDERYCADPGCDCQRVMLYAVDQDGETRAAIGYDLTSLPGRTPADENPFLEPGAQQPPGAARILEYVRAELERDAGYCNRLRRHYHELKERVREPAHPLWPAVLEDRRVMTRTADRLVRELAGAPPRGPDWARRERNRRKRKRK